MNTCEDCGCKVINGHCANCHEETFIYEQYKEQGLPDPSPEFMDKVAEQNNWPKNHHLNNKPPLLWQEK